MSYDSQSLSRAYPGPGFGSASWTYYTDFDNLDVILADGYFDEAYPQFKLHDLIICVAADQTTTLIVSGVDVATKNVVVVEANPDLNRRGSWRFDNGTAESDPGEGEFRLNNSNPNLANKIIISKTNVFGALADFSLLRENDSIFIVQANDASRTLSANVAPLSVADFGDWVTISIIPIAATSTFRNNEICEVNVTLNATANFIDLRDTPKTYDGANNTNLKVVGDEIIFDPVAFGVLSIPDNATVTNIIAQDTYYEIAGTTTSAVGTQSFVNQTTPPSLRYVNSRSESCIAMFGATFTTLPANRLIAFQLFLNGTPIPVGFAQANSGTQKTGSVSFISPLFLTQGDVIEVKVNNKSGVSDVIVEQASLIIRQAT